MKSIKSTVKLLLVGVLAVAFVSAPAPVYAEDPANPPAPARQGSNEVANGLKEIKSTDPTGGTSFTGIVQNIVNAALFLVGIISVVMLVYGGVKYSTSAGDSTKVTAAKNTIMYSIAGLIVAIMAFAIVNFVVTQMTGNNSSGTPEQGER